MSVLIIRNDDNDEEVYNRTTVFCYTRMSKKQLWDYVKNRELLTNDRQELFFKIDVDIFAAPPSMPELSEWLILSIVLKAKKRPFSFGILVKLFYECFPQRLMVDFSNPNLFICSGTLTNDGKSLTHEDQLAFRKLSSYHRRIFESSVEVSKRFKQNVVSSEEAPFALTNLAKQFNIMGGHWILFFNRLDQSKREEVFNIMLKAAYDNWNPISRFNAKISWDSFIICFGNNSTRSAVNPTLLISNQVKSEEDDPEPLEVRGVIDGIYEEHHEVLGFMGIKYKPDIVSACCIQRDNFIRPTVYQAHYGFYHNGFQPNIQNPSKGQRTKLRHRPSK